MLMRPLGEKMVLAIIYGMQVTLSWLCIILIAIVHRKWLNQF